MAGKRRISWSDDELAILAAHYPEHGSNWIGWESLLPLRTSYSIQNKAVSLGLGCDRKPRKREERRSEMPTSRDPTERTISDLMERGLTPDQIDAKMHWTPGKTTRVLREMWRRI